MSASVREMLGDRMRVVIEHVRTRVDCGEFPAKATRGLPFRVSARAFADGHDPLLTWVWHWPGSAALDPGYGSISARGRLAKHRLSRDKEGRRCKPRQSGR